MTLESYLSLVAQYTKHYDYYAVVRSYRAYCNNPVSDEDQIHALDEMIHTIPTIPLNRLKDISGMALKELRKKAEREAINAREDEQGNLYISINEYKRVKDSVMNNINILTREDRKMRTEADNEIDMLDLNSLFK